MPKTIFHTTEKSNFILNLKMDTYRRAAAKIILFLLWITAVSQGINQATFDVNSDLAVMIGDGGFGGVLALLLVSVRSVASMFSIAGVLAIVWCIIGLIRQQIPKQNYIQYGAVLFGLLWAVAALAHSYDISTSVFGQDGRDEGLITLAFYAAVFYLGSMLRSKEVRERFLRGLMTFGIVQNVWALLQMQPFFDFPSQYRMVDPLLYDNLYLPSGLTDSPITFAMLLTLLLCMSIPAAVHASDKGLRITALICTALSVLSVFKTQTIAGWIGGIGALAVLAAVMLKKRADIPGKKRILLPLCLGAAAVSLCWTYFSPALNGSYQTWDKEQLSNGFYLFDGGIVWDDSYYRLTTSGAYVPSAEHDFEIREACSVIKYCWSEGVRVIKIDPVFGIGPDNFMFTQLHSSMEILRNPNTVDRPYNNFLFVAGTRGIPSLLAHLAVIGFGLVIAWRRRKDHWTFPAAAGAVVIYSMTAFVGISVLTTAPLFWALLGFASADLLPDAEPYPVRRRNRRKQKKTAPAEPSEPSENAESTLGLS